MQRPLQRPNRLTSRLYAYRHAALFLIFLLIVQLFNVLGTDGGPRVSGWNVRLTNTYRLFLCLLYHMYFGFCMSE